MKFKELFSPAERRRQRQIRVLTRFHSVDIKEAWRQMIEEGRPKARITEALEVLERRDINVSGRRKSPRLQMKNGLTTVMSDAEQAEAERVQCSRLWKEGHALLCTKKKCLHKNPYAHSK